MSKIGHAGIRTPGLPCRPYVDHDRRTVPRVEQSQWGVIGMDVLPD